MPFNAILSPVDTLETQIGRTGRPLGKANLSDDVKIGILAQKKLQQVSQLRIAQDFGVARKTVNQLTEENLSPEGKRKLISFVDELAKARDKVITRINEKLDNDSFKDGVYPNLLQAINTNYRLETNQSTQNIAVSNHAQILHNWIATNQPNPTEIEQAIEATSDNNGYSVQELRDCLAALEQNQNTPIVES